MYRHSYINFNTMKKLIIVSAVALSGLFFNTANAQINVHFGIGFQPARVVYHSEPVVVEQSPVYEESNQVYNDDDDYYYLPDVGAYYDVTAGSYYYNDGARWVSAAYLPGEYRDYDWRNARHFEIRGRRPFLRDDFYRNHYEGQEHHDWDHNSYARVGADYGRSNYGYRVQRNDNRDFRGGEQHLDNRDYRSHDEHFQNNGRGYDQHPDNRVQGYNRDQHTDNRGQGFNRPNVLYNGHQQENRSGDRNNQNNSRSGFESHRMGF